MGASTPASKCPRRSQVCVERMAGGQRGEQRDLRPALDATGGSVGQRLLLLCRQQSVCWVCMVEWYVSSLTSRHSLRRMHAHADQQLLRLVVHQPPLLCCAASALHYLFSPAAPIIIINIIITTHPLVVLDAKTLPDIFNGALGPDPKHGANRAGRLEYAHCLQALRSLAHPLARLLCAAQAAATCMAAATAPRCSSSAGSWQRWRTPRRPTPSRQVCALTWMPFGGGGQNCARAPQPASQPASL